MDRYKERRMSVKTRSVGLAAVVVLTVVLAACGGAQKTAAPTPAPTAALQQQTSTVYIDITAQQLSEMLAGKDFTLVNVHIPYDGEIAQTDLFIPYNEIAGQLDKLPDKSARIVVYCRSGPMSTWAAQTLVAAGYANVMELDGGMYAWEAAGYELLRR
jgi:rhodanese-related sulfurtransferase